MWRCLLTFWLMLTGISVLYAQVTQPAPLYQGSALPAPPQQKAAWTPPPGVAPELLSAATALFAQGLADPRGCDYAGVSLGVGNVWSGDGGVIQTHGWVLPARAGEARRFAVAWNGLVYPVVSVDGPADLEADVRALVRQDAEARAAWAKSNPNFPFSRFTNQADAEADAVSETSFLPLKACLLLRLGDGDLARDYWQEWTAGDAPANGGTLGIPKGPYLMLASDWASSLFDRAVTAHMRGDDHLALVDAHLLTVIQPQIEAEAARRGFARQRDYAKSGPDQYKPYLDFLDPLPGLLADSERRVAETPHTPALTVGLNTFPTKAARIAALIQDLEDVSARQWGQPGGVSLGGDPVVQALVAQGDDAVDPLIDVVANDTRLTRSVSFWRDFFPYRYPQTVADAAYAALRELLHTDSFGPEGEKTADAVRAYWDKYRGVPLTERWYRTLADDTATPQQWLDAAADITQPANVRTQDGWTETTPTPPGVKPPMRGESLRARHTPSVSALMAKRAQSLAAAAASPAGQIFDPGDATQLALDLSDWDAQAALSVLRSQFFGEQQTLADKRLVVSGGLDELNLARLTIARARGGDPAAMADYLAWLRSVAPKDLPAFQWAGVFEPLWQYPDAPGAQAGVAALFDDLRSPWVPLIQKRQYVSDDDPANLIESPLLHFEAFRRPMPAALADKTVVSTVTLGGPEQMNTLYDRDPYLPAMPQAFPVRLCDLYAWHLSHVTGMPAFQYDWPEARKDAAAAQTAVCLRRYGFRLGFDAALSAPGDDYDFPNPRARLLFPRLTHPATPADVADDRAIFTLSPPSHLWPMPTFPMKARWVTDHRYAQEARRQEDGKTITDVQYQQDGYVFQAEETKAGRRYYGFVGPHDVLAVPAEQIEFPAQNEYAWSALSRQLDCRVDLPTDEDAEDVTLNIGHPLPVTLRLRNRSGLSQPVPVEYLKLSLGGPPALRLGIDLKLLYSPLLPAALASSWPAEQNRTWTEVAPREMHHFTPTLFSRVLAPTAEMSALTLDLTQWFPLTLPGDYRLQFLFSGGKSGFADGQSQEVRFDLGSG